MLPRDRWRAQISSKRLKGLVAERIEVGIDSKMDQGGKLVHKDDETGAAIAIPFGANDITDPRYVILCGSSVEYRYCHRHGGMRLRPCPLLMRSMPHLRGLWASDAARQAHPRALPDPRVRAFCLANPEP